LQNPSNFFSAFVPMFFNEMAPVAVVDETILSPDSECAEA